MGRPEPVAGRVDFSAVLLGANERQDAIPLRGELVSEGSPIAAREVFVRRWSSLVLGIAAAHSMVTAVDRPATAQGDLRPQAEAALRKAVTYYRTRVASRGGYVYHYSLDLQQRWGEGPATVDQIWVQPPGTPAVGLAYLKAYAATNDRYYLEGAQEAAEAVVYGQLQSGGWRNCVDFNPTGTQVDQYRNGKGRGNNNSTLDDGSTQTALQLVAKVDRALGLKHAGIHESARIAGEALLKAQYPNGAFPQVWKGPVPPQPTLKASFPRYDWRTEGKIKNYWDMYTLNDGLVGTVSDTLKALADTYQDERYRTAIRKLGDFLILAQLPDPQPAWAQQYGYNMHPIWARRFEPPAVTGGESQDAIETLLKIHRWTGDAKYLQPIPAALAYLKRSRLPDGRMARYYAMETNKPLYMNRNGKDYFLTYDDKDLPDHYGWKVDSRLDSLEKQYNEQKAGRPAPSSPTASQLEAEVRKVIRELDTQGRWIATYGGERLVGQPKFKPGSQYLSSTIFNRNVELLSDYLIASRPKN